MRYCLVGLCMIPVASTSAVGATGMPPAASCSKGSSVHQAPLPLGVVPAAWDKGYRLWSSSKFPRVHSTYPCRTYTKQSRIQVKCKRWQPVRVVWHAACKPALWSPGDSLPWSSQEFRGGPVPRNQAEARAGRPCKLTYRANVLFDPPEGVPAGQG